nr:hypothetical protein [Mycobacterium sp.]
MPLLEDVGQLVREQLAAGGRLSVVAAPLEDDVRTGGVRACAQVDGGRVRGTVVVHPHIGEIGAEPLLHLSAHEAVERPPRGPNDITDSEAADLRPIVATAADAIRLPRGRRSRCAW